MRLATLAPDYLPKRLRLWWYRSHHPRDPWLVESAVSVLTEWVRAGDKVFEWGSGRSTVWFGSRVEQVVSIEHSSVWRHNVEESLRSQGVSSVDLQLIPVARADRFTGDGSSCKYVEAIEAYPDGSFDMILVDGIYRAQCAAGALRKVKAGGLLILDDAHRYIPNFVGERYLSVIERRTEPLDSSWATVLESLASWRSIPLTNGLSDTRMWVKPNEEAAY